MPFASVADVPAATKAFWKRVGASATAKRQWVSVFNSCNKRGLPDSRCFAQANGVLNKRLGRNGHFVIDAALDPSAITDTELDGKPAWRIPAVFTREGVQNRAFKPWDELVKAAWTLVDAPVVFPHPPDLDSAMAHESLIIGRIVAFEADKKDRTLRGDIAVWKSDPRSQWLINALAQGFGQHGSVGFTFEQDDTSGVFNSESFINVERDLFFDHFAVGLEYFGKHGACAPPMCGLLHNEEDNMEPRDMRQNRGLSLTAIEGKIRAAFHPPTKEHEKHLFVRELFDDVAIVENGANKLFSVPYTISDSGDVTLGSRTEVQATYVPVGSDADEGGTDDVVGQCPDGQHHHPYTNECVDDVVLNKEEVARKILTGMNIFKNEALLEAATEIFADSLAECVPCQAKADQVFDDQSYTNNPAWSDVDKSKLPSSAFMVVRDQEKKSTWKLPFKNPGGAVNCNAIRAILSVLGGARGGVDLTKDERNKARRAAARHNRRCLALRQADVQQTNSKEIEEVLYSHGDINTIEDDPMDDPNNEPTGSEGNADLKEKVNELETALSSAKKSLEKFEADKDEREAAELKALRSSVHSLVNDPEVYSYNEIEAMSKSELVVVRKLLTNDGRADNGVGVSANRTNPSFYQDIEYIRGQAFSPMTIGDRYDPPTLPGSPRKEEDK
ncbi:MAG: DUF2213 domain-containing protein [Candidatus Binatia bacterium]